MRAILVAVAVVLLTDQVDRFQFQEEVQHWGIRLFQYNDIRLMLVRASPKLCNTSVDLTFIVPLLQLNQLARLS